MALDWCDHIDGICIFPKLPVYLRMHEAQYKRNQRAADATRRARQGIDSLNALLASHVPAASRPGAAPAPAAASRRRRESSPAASGGVNAARRSARRIETYDPTLGSRPN